MKKIAFSLVVVSLMASVAIGATYAVFSSSEKVEGNTVATGKLSYHVGSKTLGKPWNVDELYPDYASGWETLSMINDGTLNLHPFFYLEDEGSNAELLDVLYLELVDSGADDDCESGDEVPYYNGPLSGLMGLVNKQSVEGDPDWVANGFMPVGAEQTLCQRLSFPDPGEDRDDYQDLSASFTEYLYAEHAL